MQIQRTAISDCASSEQRLRGAREHAQLALAHAGRSKDLSHLARGETAPEQPVDVTQPRREQRVNTADADALLLLPSHLRGRAKRRRRLGRGAARAVERSRACRRCDSAESQSRGPYRPEMS